MTRICEKFVEEISSGSKSVSEELKQHIASCSECNSAFEASCSLKQARKPISAKEAAAISGIIKAIKTEAAASAATATTASASGSSVAVKLIMAVTFVVAIIATTFSGSQVSVRPDETPLTIPAVTTPATEISSTDEPLIPQPDSEPCAEDISNATRTDQTNASEASAITEANASAETDITEINTILVSPDQEEINPR